MRAVIADATAVSVNVNGVSSTIAAGRFTSTLPLDPGSNVLNVLAVDAAGNQIGVSLTVKRVTDTTPPALTLTSPASGAVLAENIVTVSGTAIDDLPGTLSATGVPIRVGPTGEFTGLLHVPFGTNQVTVVAEDAVGNRTQQVRSLTIDGTPPVISDVTPENGAMINSQAATVRGRITDDTLVSVTINGLAANVAPDKTFEAGSIPLTEGVNNLVIATIDQAGNRSIVTSC